jgi:hypothetical protein
MMAIIRLINFKTIGISLKFVSILSAGQVEHTATSTSDLEAKGLLTLNPIP